MSNEIRRNNYLVKNFVLGHNRKHQIINLKLG